VNRFISHCIFAYRLLNYLMKFFTTLEFKSIKFFIALEFKLMNFFIASESKLMKVNFCLLWNLS